MSSLNKCSRLSPRTRVILMALFFELIKLFLTCMESPDFNTVCVRLEIYRYHKPYNCTKPLSQNLNAAISN